MNVESLRADALQFLDRVLFTDCYLLYSPSQVISTAQQVKFHRDCIQCSLFINGKCAKFQNFANLSKKMKYYAMIAILSTLAWHVQLQPIQSMEWNTLSSSQSLNWIHIEIIMINSYCFWSCLTTVNVEITPYNVCTPLIIFLIDALTVFLLLLQIALAAIHFSAWKASINLDQ